MKEEEIDLVNWRKELFSESSKTSVFNKNDRRLKTDCFCNACGRQLVYFSPETGTYKNDISLYQLIIYGKCVYLCKNADVCKRYNKKVNGSEKIKVVRP